MSIEPSIITLLGDELYDALVAGETIPNLRDRNLDIDIVDAYRIQERVVARRLETGEKIIGKNAGFSRSALSLSIPVTSILPA